MIDQIFKIMGLTTISNRYTLQEEITQGKSSTCFFGIDNETNQEIFVKFLIFPRSELEIARFKNEIQFLKYQKLFNTIIKKTPDLIEHGELYDGRVLYLITDRVHGTLLSKWISQELPSASLHQRLLIAYRVFGASEHQALFYVHRDLHANNIILLDEDIDLLSDTPNYKAIILDWGQSYCREIYNYRESEDDHMAIIHNGIGREISNSFYNLPPETFQNWDDTSIQYNKYDCWAMGLLFYKLLTGEDLFNFTSIGEYAAALPSMGQKLQQAKRKIVEIHGNEYKILSEILFRLLSENPTERLDIQKARFAIWFVVVEGFLPESDREINNFLRSPTYYEGQKWKFFTVEEFDYS